MSLSSTNEVFRSVPPQMAAHIQAGRGWPRLFRNRVRTLHKCWILSLPPAPHSPTSGNAPASPPPTQITSHLHPTLPIPSYTSAYTNSPLPRAPIGEDWPAHIHALTDLSLEWSECAVWLFCNTTWDCALCVLFFFPSAN